MNDTTIKLNSYAKINLSLDVLGKAPGGYHEVKMIMHQVGLHDEVTVKWLPEGTATEVSTNLRYLPVDQRNLAWKAAVLMRSHFRQTGSIRIDIRKRIPVAAGLAGGSANGASVILALARLWNLDLTVKELCRLGEALGSDVPFCIMGQAYANKVLGEKLNNDPDAGACALAAGIGTELTLLPTLDCYVVLAKPPVSCSTKEKYGGIDDVKIPVHPDTEEMITGIKEKNWDAIIKNMVNTLENVTLKRYPIVVYTKNKMNTVKGDGAVLMSGSGPTVFGIFLKEEQARACYLQMKKEFRNSFITHTISKTFRGEDLHDKL